MRRPAFALISALFLARASVTFAAVSTSNILVSGQSTLAIVDTDGNGPDDHDCRFTATVDALGNFTIQSVQASNPPLLRACSGKYSGDVDPSFPTDTSVFGTIKSSTIVGGTGFPNVPLSFDGAFLPQQGGPRQITRVELTNGLNVIVGTGKICDSSAQLTLDDGVPMLVALGQDTPGYVRVPNVPFEKLDFSGFVLLDVFVPKTGGTVTFALDSGPALIEILLSGTCGRAAPTLSGLKLIVLAMSLLIGGVWVLGRRRAFYEALPLP